MINHQEHYDRIFYQDKKTGYWISTSYPRIRAHRWIWNNVHGIIPKGYHIHHRNEDKSDNRIENLELIEATRHLSHHASKPENRQRLKQLVDKIRPMTKEWHRSEEGRAWHRLHAIKTKFGKWEPTKHDCQQCGKQYETTKKSATRFCSNNCKSVWRRKSGIDDILKKCIKCNKELKMNKYSKKKYCSVKCRLI